MIEDLLKKKILKILALCPEVGTDDEFTLIYMCETNKELLVIFPSQEISISGD